MKIEYEPKEINRMLEEYYRQYERRNVKSNISFKKGYVGDGKGGSVEDTIVSITLTEEVTLLGIKNTAVEEVSKERLTEIFTTLLDKVGYDLDSLQYIKGLDSNFVGYGMGEQLIKKPYFSGISLDISHHQEKSHEEHSRQKTIGSFSN